MFGAKIPCQDPLIHSAQNWSSSFSTYILDGGSPKAFAERNRMHRSLPGKILQTMGVRKVFVTKEERDFLKARRVAKPDQSHFKLGTTDDECKEPRQDAAPTSQDSISDSGIADDLP